MTQIEIVDEVDGRQVFRTIEISTKEFAVKVDTTGDGEPDTLLQPAVTQEIEIENDAQQSEIQDQCGNTQRDRTGNLGWQIRVQGIVTDEVREGNLTKQDIRDIIAVEDKLTIRSELIDGTFSVSNVVLTAPNDLHSLQTTDTQGKERAFDFQLQLGESESE